MWCVLSVWLVPWLAVHALARAAGGRFPSPFPLAIGSAFFVALYAPLVARQAPADAAINVGLHAAAAWASDWDVSAFSLAFSAAVVAAYAAVVFSAGLNPFSLYGDRLPRLEGSHPGIFHPAKWGKLCACKM